MSGLPESDFPLVRGYSDDFIHSRTFEGTESAEAALARCDAFDEHLREVIADRRCAAHRPDDLLGALLDCVDTDGVPISDERILTHLSKDILVGGVETTTHLIGNLFHQILSAPGLYGRIRDERALVPAAVEESLRHMAPLRVVFRRARAAAEIGGTPIPVGSLVVLLLTSGNHDEDVFDHPHDFDIDRDGGRHLAFSSGIHLCVGAPLARLEATCALTAALDRIPAMSLAAPGPYDRIPFFMMCGPAALPVTLTA